MANLAVTIRDAAIDDAEGIARVGVDTWRTAYKGLVPDAHLASMSYTRAEAKWTERLASAERDTLVAVVSPGRIIGFASFGPARESIQQFTGELAALYVLKEFQGYGIGKRLVRACAERLQLKGHRNMYLWVIADNPATSFYERLGGQKIAESTMTIGGAEVAIVSYAWDDIDLLL